MKVVLDTNVLIDGVSDDFSVQARLIDAVRDGDLKAVVTPAIIREYRVILNRLIKDGEYKKRIEDFLEATTEVTPGQVDIQIDDPDDYKFLQAAVGGRVDAVVSNDRHLLDIGEIEEIKIISPSECWHMFEEESGSADEWQSFVQNLGIGK